MDYTVTGIDVSAWDPYIDWPMVKNQKIRFVIIKATEGLDYFSKAYDSQWAGAKSVGILRGAYHFLRANQDGAKQADFFLSKVKVEDGDLPPVLDIEEANNYIDPKNPKKGIFPNSQFIGNSQKWLERVEQLTGRTPLIYSRPTFLKDHLAGSNFKPPPWATKYPTWLAEYHYSHAPDSQPTQPVGWGDWIIWQYSGDKLTLDGIYKDEARTSLIRVDMNVYRHSLEELYKLAKAPMPADVDAPVPSTPVTVQPSQPVQPAPANPAPVSQPSVPVTPPPPPPSPAPTTTSSTSSYTIAAGDNLTVIANRFGVTVDAIAQANNIANPNLIHVGQVLQIPVSTYTIQAGDNLTVIANKFGVTVDAITRLNNIANPNLIHVGQVLQIPRT